MIHISLEAVDCRAHEDRRRQGDQAAGVPGRAHAGRCARARPARPRRRSSRRAPASAARSRTTPYERAGATIVSVDDVWARADLLLKVKEPIASEYPRLREGLDALHVPPHRRRRAADASARRLGDHRDRVRDGRDRPRRAPAARADERDRGSARRAGRCRSASRSRRAVAGSCSAASRASRRHACS